MSSKRGPPPEHGFRHDLTHSSTFRAAHSSTFRVAHSSTFRVAHSSTLHVAHSPTFYVGHTRFLHDLTHLRNFEKSDNLCIQTTLWERGLVYGSALWWQQAGGVGFRSENLKCMQFWPPFLRICRGKPQIRGRVSHVLIWTDRISGGLGSVMGSSGSCRVWRYDPTRSWLRCRALRPTRSEAERV